MDIYLSRGSWTSIVLANPPSTYTFMSPLQFVRNFFSHIRRGGVPWLIAAVRSRVWPVRSRLAPTTGEITWGKTGLEVGGPSRVFSDRGILPVYAKAARIDNVNFASTTAWESGLRDDGEFTFHHSKTPGRQFLREATQLAGIPDSTYDFILSSHCLEHVANPLAALIEWSRVTCDRGYLLLILPDPPGTFDHHRPVTTLRHLREDLLRQTGDDDLTHLPEILAFHDLTRDPLAGSAEQFHARGLRNVENRCLHHHVFDLDLMRAVLGETGWEVVETEKLAPIHLIALARKTRSPAT